jgi:hypothetical protein
MNLDFDSIGSIVGVVIGIAAIIDRAIGPQSARLKALEDRMHQQDLSTQRLALHGEGLEKVLSRLSDAIDKLEARIVEGRGAHR